MPRARGVVVSVALVLAVPITGLAIPVVTDAWTATPQVAAVAVDDVGRIFVVDENTVGDLILRAYRTDGTPRWERSWHRDGAALSAGDVALGPDGTVIVSAVIDPEPPGDCDEIWNHGWAIAVWDRAGHLLWHRAQPGWRTCEAFATSGAAVAGGGDTIALVARQADEYSSRARIIAFDLQGRERWRFVFRRPGSGQQRIDGVAVGANGAVFVSGTFDIQTLDSPPTDQDTLLLKLRADGSRAWQRIMPDPERRDQRAGGLTLSGGSVVMASLTDERGQEDRIRVAAYAFDGSLRWANVVERAVQSGWGDGHLATWRRGPVLATTHRDPEGAHVLLRGYGPDGAVRWSRQLRIDDRATVATGLAASRAAIVAVGRPRGQAGDRSRIWVLEG